MSRHIWLICLMLAGICGCSKDQPTPSTVVMVLPRDSGATEPTTEEAVSLLKGDGILEHLATKYHLAFGGTRFDLVKTLRTSFGVKRSGDTQVYTVTSTLKPRTLGRAMLDVWMVELSAESGETGGNQGVAQFFVKYVSSEPLEYTAEEIDQYESLRRQCRSLPDISF